MVGLNISPEDISIIPRLPYSMVISDSLYNLTDTPHPRIYASFPHILRHYVEETHALTMQEAIHKMTQLPAQRMRYQQRGTLKPGNFADVLVFDPATSVTTQRSTMASGCPPGWIWSLSAASWLGKTRPGSAEPVFLSIRPDSQRSALL